VGIRLFNEKKNGYLGVSLFVQRTYFAGSGEVNNFTVGYLTLPCADGYNNEYLLTCKWLYLNG